MVDYVPGRLYSIDINGTLLGPGDKIVNSVHKDLGLDTQQASREFFEVLDRLVVPHPQVLYSNSNPSCVEHAMGLSDWRIKQRFNTINEMIEASDEDQLKNGLKRKFDDPRIYDDNAGYLKEIVVSIVPPEIAEQLVPSLQELLRICESLRNPLGDVSFFNESTVKWNLTFKKPTQ